MIVPLYRSSRIMPSAIDSSAVVELSVNPGVPRELLGLSKGLPPPLWSFPPLSACAEDDVFVEEDVLLELVEDLEVDAEVTTGTVVIGLDAEGGGGAVGIDVSVIMLFDDATMDDSSIVLWPMDWLADEEVDFVATPVVVVTTATSQRT